MKATDIKPGMDILVGMTTERVARVDTPQEQGGPGFVRVWTNRTSSARPHRFKPREEVPTP